MSLEENKATDLRFFEEVVNKGNMALLDELLTPDFVDHSATPGTGSDRESYGQMFLALQAAFPDFHSTLEDMFGEGDKVVQRFTAGGTHKGEFMGIPATGKQVTITGIAIHHFRDGKIAANWADMDMLGFLQQLGVIPTPGQAAR
ncbi:MAG: ester cyclase [Chloroflexi bacterium]|nr:ester cyclase [Chloroflexota bacterium]